MIDYSERLQIAVGDRYRIERELGSGGMATVYLADDLKHNRKVAIKVLQRELAAAMGPDRFLREIEISAQLQHPHILMLIDSGQVADSLYYVMPYVTGESLRDRLDRDGELPVNDAARILRDVVDALAYAHRQGVVHRDMKPDNVLLSERHALVTDFGVATAVSAAAGRAALEATGLALGTPAYMAPEQAVAHEQIDHRADIYAVGALGYELLTGRPPFVGDTPQQVLAAQVRETPEPVSQHRRGVPPELEQLVMRCLEKKPEDRWQGAEEMLPSLEQFAATAPGAKDSSGRRRRRVAAALGIALVVVVAAVVILRIAGESATLDPRRVIVVPFRNLSGEPQFDPYGQVAASWISEGLQQAELVRVVPIQAVEAALERRPDEDLEALAESMGAGTAVSGSYHVQGDSVHFTTEIMDVGRTELLGTAPTASALISDPMGAMEQLRREVLGELAGHFDPRVTEFVDEARRPPLFSAFRSYLMGMERFTRYDNAQALPHFYRAAQLDTGFVTPVIAAAVANWNLGEYERSDSLIEVVKRRRESLLPLDGHFYDFAAAIVGGDYWAAHEAAQSALSISAGGGWWEYQAARTALAANHPRAALDHLSRIDPEEAVPQERPLLWSSMADAYHLLQEYREELRVALRGRAVQPDWWNGLTVEVRARAALGRLDEVNSLLDSAAALPEDISRRWDLMTMAALELRAHGYTEAYRTVIRRAIDWLDSRPQEEQAQPDFAFMRARTLYWAERWDEAWVLFTDFGTQVPPPASRFGFLGVTDARVGGDPAAQHMYSLLATLNRPHLFGEALAWRARIAAVMGREEEAVRLLGEAFREGLPYTVSLHRDIDFESLRGYAPFETLMRGPG